MSLSLETITSAEHTRIKGQRRRRTLAAGLIAAFDLLCDWTERNRQREHQKPWECAGRLARSRW
jgi:2-keto-4-pentenoate hydratase/2-oxohepta-3-ene-1,7-dioic acid hydratase in catechol pathway